MKPLIKKLIKISGYTLSGLFLLSSAYELYYKENYNALILTGFGLYLLIGDYIFMTALPKLGKLEDKAEKALEDRLKDKG